MRPHTSSLALAVALFAGTGLHAHPGFAHDHDANAPGMRLWKSASGGSQFLAAFVHATSDEVQFADTAGKRLTLPRWFLCAADEAWIGQRVTEIQRMNGHFVVLQEADTKMPTPAIQKAFEPFKDKMKVRTDENFFYVESDGLPSHPMMKGIRAWQQQVPLPQPYTGNNAWRIPLKPMLADKPISAKRALFRGAIALAVNGVPIFNALNNRGEDAFLAGELDQWGGHCGRGDDYHYHVAPLHLEKIAGVGRPLAYALDGFPIFGLTEADGSPVGKLDEFNGKFGKDGTYRYHATKTYPYINGGMRGVVDVHGDQIDPQPRDLPARPGQQPLKGATITDFSRDDATKTFALKYDLRGKTHSVNYTINQNSSVTFVFDKGTIGETTETYRRDPKDAKKKKKGPGRDEEQDDSPPWPPMWIGLVGVGGMLGVGAVAFFIRRGIRK